MLATMDSDRSLSLTQSFGVAACLIIFGVLATWTYLKRFSELYVLELPEIAQVEFEQGAAAETEATATWVLAGEEAYAAGRIVEPPADNAMFYFQRALAQAPGQEAALAGLERITQHLRGGVESAIFRGDWETSRSLVSRIQSIDPDNVESRLLLSRIGRFESVERLSARADAQIAGGRLTQPRGDNALASFHAILEIEPENAKALQGLASIVQRLLGFAQSAALAGEQAKAQGFVDKARAIDPNAPGLSESDQLVAEWTRMVNNQRIKEQLEAASAALQAGRLTGPESPNALSLFNHVLELEPNSEAARQGKRLVVAALLDRAWAAVRANRFDDAQTSITRAEVAGAEAGAVSVLTQELEYQQRLVRARRGEFERIYSISELEARRQELPAYPRGTKGTGWVQVAFTVSEEGEIIDAVVEESSSEAFHGSAVSAITRWRFKPFLVNGRPMPVRSKVKFSFEE